MLRGRVAEDVLVTRAARLILGVLALLWAGCPAGDEYDACWFGDYDAGYYLTCDDDALSFCDEGGTAGPSASDYQSYRGCCMQRWLDDCGS